MYNLREKKEREKFHQEVGGQETQDGRRKRQKTGKLQRKFTHA